MFIFTTPTPRAAATLLFETRSIVEDKEKRILIAHVSGHKLLEINQKLRLQHHVARLVLAVDVAESGSKGEHLRDGRKSQPRLVHTLGASPC